MRMASRQTMIPKGDTMKRYATFFALLLSAALTVNDGDSFNTIETGAAGGVIEAKTSDDKVATAEVDKTNNAVKITPVGNGDAKITVTTPRYTKAFSAGSITIPVHVTGFSAEAEDTTLTITGAPTAATAEPFTMTVDTNSDGEITVTVDPKDAATVAVSLYCSRNQAACVRVHNVFDTVTAMKMQAAL